MSTTHVPPYAYRFGRFEMRPAQRSLLADGVPLAIGARAYDLLLVLVAERDRVVSHDELLAHRGLYTSLYGDWASTAA